MAGERTLPGLGLKAGWTAGSAGYGPDIETNYRILSALVQGNVISRTTALPSSGSTGDIYLVQTGDANAESVAIWDEDNGAAASWIYLVPEEGWILYVLDANEHVSFDGTTWVTLTGGSSSQPYDIRAAFLSTPGDDEVIEKIHIVREVTFLADFAGSIGSVEINPTAAYTLDVKDDGTTIGTISISTAGAVTFSTVGNTAKVVAVGSVITFQSQATADTTVDGANFTLLGSV